MEAGSGNAEVGKSEEENMSAEAAQVAIATALVVIAEIVLFVLARKERLKHENR